jgi:hypothetical protein
MRSNVTGCNGSARNWPGDGVHVNYAYGTKLQALRAFNNGGRGIYSGVQGSIRAGDFSR